MNWGHSIILAYLLFGGLIAAMVVICMGQDVSLVATDYYKQEIAYQEQIDRLQNVKDLSTAPTTAYDKGAGQVVITFPKEIQKAVSSGSVHFYRPSQAALDKKYTLSLDEQGQEVISTENMDTGLWKVRLNWTLNDQQYYHEKIVVI